MAVQYRPWLLVATILIADQVTKAIIHSLLAPSDSVPVIPGILHLSYVQNTGMAFGLFRGYPVVFALLAVAVSVWIVRELAQPADHGPLTLIALACVLGGALGNLVDRIRFGYVVDFIDLRVWPVFNVADSAITIGIVLLVLQTIFAKKDRPSDVS